MNLADIDLHTNVILSGSVSMVSGKKYVGMSSGATGYSRTNGSTSNILFEGVTGTFIHNEQIALDEAPTAAIGTIHNAANDGVTDYQFTDCNSFYNS